MKKRIVLLIVVMLVLALSACGQNDDPTQATNDPTDSMSTQPATTGGERDKIVRVTGAFPLRTDPHIAYNGVEQMFLHNVYDTIIFCDSSGAVTNHLCTGYETSEDGLTYTFTLRDDVLFHDGVTYLKASDVVFSFNRMMTMGEGYAYLFKDYVESVEAIDDTTVAFHLVKPYGPFISALMMFPICSETMVMANLGDGNFGEYGDYGSAWLLANDAGSGPYKMTNIAVDEAVTAKKFDEYFLGWGENNPETVQILNISDGATIKTMMANGELEITDEWQSTETLNALEAMDGITVAKMDTGKTTVLEMNTKIAPTDDVHYRRALSYLFDYTTCMEQIMPGTKELYGQISSSYDGYSEDLFQYEYNVEKAKEELALSKYADNYQDYELDIQWSDSVSDEEKICLLFQQCLNEVGITLNILSTPWSTMSANAASIETTPHLSVCLPCADFPDTGAFLLCRYHTNASGSSQSYEWLMDPTFDAMLEDAMAEADPDIRWQKYYDCQEYIIDLAPSIFCCTYLENRAYQSGYLYWPEAEMAANGESLSALANRTIYFRTMEFIN